MQKFNEFFGESKNFGEPGRGMPLEALAPSENDGCKEKKSEYNFFC